MSDTYDLTYLSLGAGVQSTAVLVMAAEGIRGCPRPSHAIFSDTGDEPAWVYDHLEWCRGLCERSGIDLRVVSRGRLSDSLRKAQTEMTRFASIPAFTPSMDGRSHGILRRQCTREYKIEPIEKEVRRLLGLVPRQRAAGRFNVLCLLGISTDEAIRMKPSRKAWITNHYPLIDADMSRNDCHELLRDHGVPPTRKSSCVFCPYHSDAFWHSLKEDHPAEFAKAVRVDNDIREATRRGATQRAYLHPSLTPLDEVDFIRWRDIKGQSHLFDLDGFGNECEGMCGV